MITPRRALYLLYFASGLTLLTGTLDPRHNPIPLVFLQNPTGEDHSTRVGFLAE
jgi:hypothetical protein